MGFSDEIIDFKRELRDLKTAHARGFGLTKFYKAELTVAITANTYYSFTASVLPGEPSPAFIQMFMRSNPETDIITKTTTTNNSQTIHLVSLTDTTLTIQAQSTSKITLEQS